MRVCGSERVSSSPWTRTRSTSTAAFVVLVVGADDADFAGERNERYMNIQWYAIIGNFFPITERGELYWTMRINSGLCSVRQIEIQGSIVRQAGSETNGRRYGRQESNKNRSGIIGQNTMGLPRKNSFKMLNFSRCAEVVGL